MWVIVFLKCQCFRIIQVRVLFTRANFGMIRMTNFDKKSVILLESDVRYLIPRKVSYLNHRKIRSSENRSHLNHRKIRTFQKSHYPPYPFVQGLKGVGSELP